MPIQKTIHQTRKEFDKKIQKSGQYWIEKFPARLGNYARVVAIPGKPGMVYARLETSGQVVEAVNWLAPGIFDFPVFVGRDKSQPSVLKVSEIRWVYALGTVINYIVFHHQQHEYPAADTVWVRRDQFMPLLVLPAGGLSARLFGDVIYALGMDHPVRVEDADLDLSSYAITIGAKYVLLEALSDGTLHYIEGDVFDSKEILELQPLPTPSESAFPICAFEFFAGQTDLRRDSAERSIIDLRMFTSDTATGAGTQINDADSDIPADDDQFGFWDIVDNVLKSATWEDLKALLKTYFDTLYSAIGHTHDVPGVHTHGLARWDGTAGQDTFDLPDVADTIEAVMLNGLEEDPFYYSLSSDGTQIILDDALTSDTLITAHYVIRSIS